MSNSEPLITADLYLAAALIVSGHRPQQLIPEHRRTLFLFDISAGVRETANRYYTGSLKVDAISYAEALRSAKGAAINLAGRGGQ